MIIICALFFWTLPAEAALITIEIEGVVDIVGDPENLLEGKIKTGDAIVGTYTYDLLTPDSEPYAWAGMYEHRNPPAGISLTVGDFTFATNPDNVDFVVAILNDYPPLLKDQFWMRSYNNISLHSGTMVDIISWQLDDPSGTALSSTSLLTGPPVLSDWQSNILVISGHRTFGIWGHITSAVPEPTTIFLFGIGFQLLRKRT